MSGEDFLALPGLVTGGILQFTLVDINSVVESTSRSGVAWLNLEVTPLLLVWKEKEAKGPGQQGLLAGQIGMMGN